MAQVSLTRHETSLHLVEVSPHLTLVQHQTLSGEMSDTPSVISNHGIPVSWYKNIENLPTIAKGFDAYVSNEFFDALPVHKFQKNDNGVWNEIMVDFASEDKLKFITTKGETPASKAYIQVSDIFV